MPRKEFGSDQTKEAKSLAAVAATFKGFRPAPEVLRNIQSVPTIFPQYNAMTKVAGHPLARITLVHGPSSEGKSSFTLGLGLSFLQRNHFFGLVDAERTTPPEWLRGLMGSHAEHPGFVALPSSTYEETVDGVRDFCDRIAEARGKGQLPEQTSGLIVVDSLRKLVPKKLMEKLSKSAGAEKNGVDGIGGRAGQIKAALNAAWVDELVPLLADTNCSLVFIGRESANPDAGMFDEDFRVTGGKAVFYDSALALRITRKFIPHPDEALAKTGSYVGERHQIELRKTKVGTKERKRPRVYFHTSNGVLSPAGFDRTRDVLEFGLDTGVIDRKGSWYWFDGDKIGNGEFATLRRLWDAPEVVGAIERAANEACGAAGFTAQNETLEGDDE